MKTLPKFDRDAVFAAVDQSNQRFQTYTMDQRRKFYADAKAVRKDPTGYLDREHRPGV